MIEIRRTRPDDPDFIGLVRLLDADLRERDGKEQAFYAPFNTLDGIRHAVVAYEDGAPAGCGAIKAHAPGVMEIKRMFTRPESRGRGAATAVLSELEKWAADLACGRCVLETGRRQPEAIALYVKNGYRPVPNYGPYAGVANSVCFGKEIG
jgi:putative acetyltransferase